MSSYISHAKNVVCTVIIASFVGLALQSNDTPLVVTVFTLAILTAVLPGFVAHLRR